MAGVPSGAPFESVGKARAHLPILLNLARHPVSNPRSLRSPWIQSVGELSMKRLPLRSLPSPSSRVFSPKHNQEPGAALGALPADECSTLMGFEPGQKKSGSEQPTRTWMRHQPRRYLQT